MDYTSAQLRHEVERLREIARDCTRWLTRIEEGKAGPADLSAFLDSLDEDVLPNRVETLTLRCGDNITLTVHARPERLSADDKAFVLSLTHAFHEKQHNGWLPT